MKIPCKQCGKKFWQTDGHNPQIQRFCSKSCGAKHSALVRKAAKRK